jgi:hypothetical protein
MNPAIDRACIPIIDKIKLIYTRKCATKARKEDVDVVELLSKLCCMKR